LTALSQPPPILEAIGNFLLNILSRYCLFFDVFDGFIDGFIARHGAASFRFGAIKTAIRY